MLSPAAVLRSLRNISLFSDSRRRRRRKSEGPEQEIREEDCHLRHLPVDVQLLLLTFLTPRDLCRLGATCHYWSWMVRDPLLWRYFLLRDAALWSSVDHMSTPRLHYLAEPPGGDSEADSEADSETETEHLDFMAEYLRCCPECRSRQCCTPPFALSSFLHSLVSDTEPRFSMFGPGLEQLNVSLMNVMMNSPRVLKVAGIPQRQINGIGSGISFLYDAQHKFNIITLYSTYRAERDRAREERSRVESKVFVQEDDDDDGGGGRRSFSVAPQFQEVFRSVNGFIYVANAETHTAVREEEFAQISAALQPVFGPPSRPLLVLSCVSRDGENRRTSVCVSVAHQLQLSLLPNPWMVQDVVADSLSGLMEGIGWLLRHSGLKV